MLKTLRRDLGSQVRQSRNLNENAPKRIARTFWASIYLVKGIRVAVRSMGRESLGSAVIHEGKRRFISNWANSEHPTVAGDGFYQQDVPRSELRSVRSVSEYWHRFNFGFDHYMSNRHGADVNGRIYRKLLS